MQGHLRDVVVHGHEVHVALVREFASSRRELLLEGKPPEELPRSDFAAHEGRLAGRRHYGCPIHIEEDLLEEHSTSFGKLGLKDISYVLLGEQDMTCSSGRVHKDLIDASRQGTKDPEVQGRQVGFDENGAQNIISKDLENMNRALRMVRPTRLKELLVMR